MRVKTMKKKLDEIIPTLNSPVPSPDINAPSPSPDSDLELPTTMATPPKCKPTKILFNDLFSLNFTFESNVILSQLRHVIFIFMAFHITK